MTVAVAAVVGLAGCGSSPVWTQLLGDAGHTGANPAETSLSSRTVATLHPTWTVPSNTSSAVVDGRETSDNDVLGSLIAGDLAWTYDGSGPVTAYRLGGCGAAVCAPVKRYSAPWVNTTLGFLVTQGKLVAWGLQGIHVLAP